jgi:hypothetical protein
MGHSKAEIPQILRDDESFVDELHDMDGDDACPETHPDASYDLSSEGAVSMVEDIRKTFDG